MFSRVFQKKMGVRSHVIFSTACISTVLMFLPNSCHPSDLFSKHLAWGVFGTLLGLLTSNHWPRLYFSALAMSTLPAIATWSCNCLAVNLHHQKAPAMLLPAAKTRSGCPYGFLICCSPLIHLQLMGETIYCVMFHCFWSKSRMFQ